MQVITFVHSLTPAFRRTGLALRLQSYFCSHSKGRKVDIFWHLRCGRPRLGNREAARSLTLDVNTLSTGSTKLQKNSSNR